MKIKSLQFYIILLVMGSTSFPQDFSLYANAGYSFPFAKELTASYDGQSIEIIKTAFSEGFIIKGGASYFISDNLGFDLGISYLSERDTIQSKKINKVTESFTNSNLSISPSIILKTKISLLTPYIKLGCSINFVKVNLFLNEFDHPSYEYSTDYSIGLNSGLGLKLMADNNFSIFTEVSLSMLTFYADKVAVSSAYRAIKEYNLSDNYQFGVDTRIKEIQDFSFNSVSLSIGIVVDL